MIFRKKNVNKCFCKNHPDREAVVHCAGCGGYFCRDDVDVRKISDEFTAYICRACGGKCELTVPSKKAKPAKSKSAAEARPEPAGPPPTFPAVEAPAVPMSAPRPVKKPAIPPQRPETAGKPYSRFYVSVPGSLFFPFLGAGIFVLMVYAGIFYALAEYGRFRQPAVFMLWVVVLTFFSMHLMTLARATLRGIHRIPVVLSMDDWREGILPLLHGGLAVWLSFLPATAYGVFTQNIDAALFALVAAGMAVLPMLLARVLLVRRLRAFQPLDVFTALGRTLGPYLYMVVFLTALLVALVYVKNDWAVARFDRVYLLNQVVGVYYLLVMFRILALFGKIYRDRLLGRDA